MGKKIGIDIALFEKVFSTFQKPLEDLKVIELHSMAQKSSRGREGELICFLLFGARAENYWSDGPAE